MDLELKGKRALVLGASRGLGAAIANELAIEGAEKILETSVDRGAHEAMLNKLASEL